MIQTTRIQPRKVTERTDLSVHTRTCIHTCRDNEPCVKYWISCDSRLILLHRIRVCRRCRFKDGIFSLAYETNVYRIKQNFTKNILGNVGIGHQYFIKFRSIFITHYVEHVFAMTSINYSFKAVQHNFRSVRQPPFPCK